MQRGAFSTPTSRLLVSYKGSHPNVSLSHHSLAPSMTIVWRHSRFCFIRVYLIKRWRNEAAFTFKLPTSGFQFEFLKKDFSIEINWNLNKFLLLLNSFHTFPPLKRLHVFLLCFPSLLHRGLDGVSHPQRQPDRLCKKQGCLSDRLPLWPRHSVGWGLTRGQYCSLCFHKCYFGLSSQQLC